MTIKRVKIRRSWGKSWFRDIGNRVMNYRHKGQDNDVYLIHMFHRCRIDRTCCYPRVWRWK